MEGYCNASKQQERELAIQNLKKYSLRLALLEHFYQRKEGKTQAEQLQKLCVLLGQENNPESNQENNEEQIQLLTKIYRILADLPMSKCG